eukprot:COSAG02_NODE_1190_length_13989_cov_9.869978_10_plen_50_part_00
MIKTFLAGGGGGASLVVVGHPLDTVKVRLQADAAGKCLLRSLSFSLEHH